MNACVFSKNEFIKIKRSIGLLTVSNPDTHRGQALTDTIDFPQVQQFCMIAVLTDLFIFK